MAALAEKVDPGITQFIGTGRLSVSIFYKDGSEQKLPELNVVHYTHSDGMLYSRVLENDVVGTGRNFNESVHDLVEMTDRFIKNLFKYGERLSIEPAAPFYLAEFKKLEESVQASSLLEKFKRRPKIEWHASVLQSNVERVQPSYSVA